MPKEITPEQLKPDYFKKLIGFKIFSNYGVCGILSGQITEVISVYGVCGILSDEITEIISVGYHHRKNDIPTSVKYGTDKGENIDLPWAVVVDLIEDGNAKDGVAWSYLAIPKSMYETIPYPLLRHLCSLYVVEKIGFNAIGFKALDGSLGVLPDRNIRVVVHGGIWTQPLWIEGTIVSAMVISDTNTMLKKGIL